MFKMKVTARSIKSLLALLALGAGILISQQIQAADLPLAAASPLSGVAFDDKPLLLPVQRNFQMAMLTAGSELGRSCGRMEAYGWRMSQSEQGRVNQIFNNTVDKLRLMGYTIEAQNLSSVSKDVTIFTADTRQKHFMFLWSAGELGLVMNLCETSAPVVMHNATPAAEPSVQTFAVPMDDVASGGLEPASRLSARQVDNFSPVGKWIGTYTCAQGITGGTMQIDRLKGQDFEGTFRFYPTPKNGRVPEGSYSVYGQYDRDSKRILINPGKWIKRPPHYYNTVMVGSFDPAHDAFSAYFQGVAGCTSFEAHHIDEHYYLQQELSGKAAARKALAKKRAVHKKKPAAKPATVTPAPVSAAPVTPSVIEGVTPPPAPAAAPASGVTAAPPPSAVPLPASDKPAASAPPATSVVPTAPVSTDNGILLAAPPSK
jgi:hypothetical protein